MKFVKFEITGYRAIDKITVDLNHQIIPIIGVNEAGKTSILQAILSFDKNQDKINNGNHLQYENRYAGINKQSCTINSHVLFNNNDFNNLYKYLKVKSDNSVFDILKKVKKNKEPIIISRILSQETRPYKLIYPDIDDEKLKTKIINYTLRYHPFILYFDDFTDRVPTEILFSKEYKNSGKIPGRRNTEWLFIIEEIFNRAGAESLSENTEEKILQTFMKLDEKDKRDDFLSDITDVLEKEIIQEWKEMKKRGLNKFADDLDDLELEIEYDENRYTFSFKVRDKSFKNKQRTFNISQRSKGFQWFFNYMVKLKFNPKYKDDATNSIYLLDEPGSYLHSSAQQELLKNLEKVSRKNNIIYCTHSHYLLDPNVIKLGSIRIAEKQKPNINLTNYGNYKGKSENGALSPIYQALQLNISNDFIGNVAIFEGITDFYFFSIIQENSKLIKKQIKLIPGKGSGASSTMISFGLSFADNFIVIFDNDQGGDNGIKKYKKVFGESILSKFHKYSNTPNTRLESLISKKDREYLQEKTKTNDIKKSFGIFFYDKKEFHKEFIKNLSEETTNNIQSTINVLNKL